MFEEKDFEEYIFDEEDVSYIYMFLKNGKVLYVGKAKDINSRMKSHKMLHEEFDKLVFKKCKSKEALKLEDYYMIKYNPKYNKNYNACRKSIDILVKELRDEGNSYLDIFEKIKKYDPKVILFKNKEIITIKEYKEIKEKFKK